MKYPKLLLSIGARGHRAEASKMQSTYDGAEMLDQINS
jgi:hypothetical protein